MEKYSLEKSLQEAERIKSLIGEGDTSKNIEVAQEEIKKEKREIILKLREELEVLVTDSIFVIDMENSPDELADFMVDVLPRGDDVENVKSYLATESNLEIIREEQGPRFGHRFFVRIKQ